MYYRHMAGTSALEHEICEQPAVLARRRQPTAAAVEACSQLIRRPSVSHLVVAARGSSANAARYARYLLGDALGMAVYPAAPALYQESGGPSLAGAAVLGISQSGQSPDIVGVLVEARRQGRPTAAITNDPDSPLASAADVVVPLLAGVERSVAATKTYTATLQTVVQICAQLAGDSFRRGLDSLPDLTATCVQDALASIPEIVSRSAQPTSSDPFLTVIGRGTGAATASETALKIREVAELRTESYSVPDLLHGPISANGPGSSSWIVASPSYPSSYWDDLAARLLAQGVEVSAVVADRGAPVDVEVLHTLPKDLPPWLFDFLAVVVGQVAALALGEAIGLDVDNPRGLSKVTRTA